MLTKRFKEENQLMTRKLFRGAVSLALALLMLTPAIPTVHAVDEKCECGAACTSVVMMEANCQQVGIIKYICTSSTCGKEQLKEVPKNPNNHDTVCTDNGDGLTHTATCRVCATYRDIKENHTFENGYCVKCSAADYAKADISMDSALETYVDLADTQATLSAGEIAVKVGNVDVTDNYTLSYSWIDPTGATVSNSATYLLPVSYTSKVADFTFGCVVTAMPKGISSGKFVSKSCTITVHVRDLVMATATVNSDDVSFELDETTSITPVSIAQQIYQAAYNLSEAYPAYVVFGTHPESSVGSLRESGSRYYFEATAGQPQLNDVKFVPSGDKAGSYVINFTVYDTKGISFPGVLTFIVEHNIGTVDLAYVAEKNQIITLDADDFQNFWHNTYDKGSLTLLSFSKLPSSIEGTLYYNYSDKSLTGALVRAGDIFYDNYKNTTQYLIDNITFVPDSKFTGYVTIPFEAYGLNNQGRNTFLTGNLGIFIGSGTVQDISFTADSSAILKLAVTDFLSTYQQAVNTYSTDFSIRLLETPENGALYVDYKGNGKDIALTDSTVSDYAFYSNSTLSLEISDLTYVAPATAATAVTDTIRYVACDNKGEFRFVGEIVFTTKAKVVIYTKYFSDVTRNDWFYDEVMTLAEAGIINGMTTTTFEPLSEVTYGQALKLIMMAAGYPNIAPTGTHWASGFLTVAQTDSLVSTALTESNLDLKIRRNDIAQIAAKALKLPASTLTTSPFADVTVGSTYASYIFSLYDAGIITGSTNLQGETVYYGVNSIRRSEMAAIVLRMNEYKNS